ncbi:MAG: arylsulfatase [Acidimicrobiaceae bacterium]|nr:arylsulfatase [Acidimicrobiaceae bacterium]
MSKKIFNRRNKLNAKKSSAAYLGFDGTIGRVHATSVPSWSQRTEPHESAPNILIVLCDDLGFSDLGSYGSEIDTPNLDALANEGLRYTNFHVNPMCSPTRASLLTGLNSHLAGLATVCHADPGFPGYAASIRGDAATLAEILSDNGWATLMVGKWHLTPDNTLSEAGPKSSWPCQRGFDRYYGILDGFTNFHQPHRLYEDNHVVHTDSYPESYFFTDDLTDHALDMIREVRTGHPKKPWFMYFSHGAVHAPLQAPSKDIKKYEGLYNKGWDQIRKERYERQLSNGLIPKDTVLPPRNSEENYAVSPWDELTDMEKETFARYQEIYAAMVDNLDQNFGRLRKELEAMGEWENTLIVFTSDNGASREGLDNGTSAYFRTLISQVRKNPLDSLETDNSRLGLLGGPQALAHYPNGWAMASNTPFRLYKTNTHQGGHQVPLIISKGKGLEKGGSLRRQYQHVTDVLPTILEMLGIDSPKERKGQKLVEPTGNSFLTSFENEEAESTHKLQYYEQEGHRGIYRDGWSAVTCHQKRTSFETDKWELFELATDPTETRDLSDKHPEVLAELKDLWEKEAWANQVFPLDEGTGLKNIARPQWEEELEQTFSFLPDTPTVERYRSLKLINSRSFKIVISLDYKKGDEGILVAHGDQGGGYSIYIEDGQLFHVHNGYGVMSETSCGELKEGVSEISLDIEASGDLNWQAKVYVDQTMVAETSDLPVLTAMAPFEGIDIGIDRRSPVSWSVYERHGTFPYKGVLNSVTYFPGELAPDAGTRWVDFLRESGVKYE